MLRERFFMLSSFHFSLILLSRCYSLDSVGIAGFSHDFGALDGKKPLALTALESLGTGTGGGALLSPLMAIIGPILPFLLRIPTKRSKVMTGMRDSLEKVGNELWEKTRKEKIAGEKNDKSIIGLLSE